jgi:exonuclease V
MTLNRLKQLGMERIGVTTLCSQLWCEMQTELDLQYGKKRTEAMVTGDLRHQELHEEVAELVPVKTETTADRVAVLFQNMCTDFSGLLQEGLTRELFVMGSVPPLQVLGQIDELLLKEERVLIRDYKTRRSPTLPSSWQQRCEEMQLMFYYHLLKDMACGEFTLDGALDIFNLGREDVVSDEFCSTVSKKGLQLCSLNVSEIGEEAFSLVRQLPTISEEFTIVYEHQESKNYIGEHRFLLNRTRFSRELGFILEYWRGEREAIPVGEKNRWKCRFCSHVSICPVWTAEDPTEEEQTDPGVSGVS